MSDSDSGVVNPGDLFFICEKTCRTTHKHYLLKKKSTKLLELLHQATRHEDSKGRCSEVLIFQIVESSVEGPFEIKNQLFPCTKSVAASLEKQCHMDLRRVNCPLPQETFRKET